MATNRIRKDGYHLSVEASDPTTPASGAPVRFGLLTGVALTDEAEGGNAAGFTSVDFGPSVWDLSVKGVNDSGNSAVAVGDAIFYVDADTPKLSKKSSGYFFGFALEAVGSGQTDTINVMHAPSPGSGTLGTGTVGTTNLASGAVTDEKLGGNLAIGFIPLDITTVRIISSNAIQNTTEGGVPDGNTTPILARVNGATDKALRLTWAATVETEVQFAPVPKPPDLDGATDLTIHLLVAKDANNDATAAIDVQVFDGVGDTEMGGNTAAITETTPTEKTVTIAHANVGDPPGVLNISLVPGTHANDAIYLYAAWIEYTRND